MTKKSVIILLILLKSLIYSQDKNIDVTHISGNGDLIINVIIDDENQLTGNKYEITLREISLGKLAWTLTDKTLNKILFLDVENFNFTTPVVNGFQIKVNNLSNSSYIKDFQVVSNTAGVLNPPEGGSQEWNGFPNSITQTPTPGRQQSTNNSTWLFHTGDNGGTNGGGNRGSFAEFLARSIRNDNYERLVPYDWEMRFTAQGSYAVDAYMSEAVIHVPFEIWNVGINTPDDPSDDYKMIPYIIDWDGDRTWNLSSYGRAGTTEGPGGPEHSASGDDDDPFTDWIYWRIPGDKTPGTAGYDAYEAGLDTANGVLGTYSTHGADEYEIMARTVLINYNAGETPPFEADVPEVGTVFRIISTKPISTNDVFNFNTEYLNIDEEKLVNKIGVGLPLFIDWNGNVNDVKIETSVNNGLSWVLVDSGNLSKPYSFTHSFNLGTSFKIRVASNSVTPSSSASYTTTKSVVVENPVNQTITLSNGWNIIGSSLIQSEDSLTSILKIMVDNGKLDKVIDERGRTFEEISGYGWQNNIGKWEDGKGYYVKVKENMDLVLSGYKLISPFVTYVNEGWNIFGYPGYMKSENPLTMLNHLISNNLLVKVQDEQGNAIEYIDNSWVNGIGNFSSGEGYYIKVNSSARLEFGSLSKSRVQFNKLNRNNKTNYFERSYSNNPYTPMNLYIETSSIGSEVEEIGIFDGSLCVGSAKVNRQNKFTSVVCGKDEYSTSEVEGYRVGEEIRIRAWNGKEETEIIEYVIVNGVDNRFDSRKTIVYKLTGITSVEENSLPTEYMLTENYPNPFNPSTNFEVRIPKSSQIRIEVINNLGQVVKTIYRGVKGVGVYSYSWDASRYSSGVYLLKIEAVSTNSNDRYIKLNKMVLIK